MSLGEPKQVKAAAPLGPEVVMQRSGWKSHSDITEGAIEERGIDVSLVIKEMMMMRRRMRREEEQKRNPWKMSCSSRKMRTREIAEDESDTRLLRAP